MDAPTTPSPVDRHARESRGSLRAPRLLALAISLVALFLAHGLRPLLARAAPAWMFRLEMRTGRADIDAWGQPVRFGPDPFSGREVTHYSIGSNGVDEKGAGDDLVMTGPDWDAPSPPDMPWQGATGEALEHTAAVCWMIFVATFTWPRLRGPRREVRRELIDAALATLVPALGIAYVLFIYRDSGGMQWDDAVRLATGDRLVIAPSYALGLALIAGCFGALLTWRLRRATADETPADVPAG